MISCLIWPLNVSWHHHNGLGTQNTNLHIMKSAYLCKIDCISVNIDRFSSKFRYVVAKTILYQLTFHQFSFWWRHHSENDDYRAHIRNFLSCVLCLWKVNFVHIINLHVHDIVFLAVSRLFLLYFVSNFSWPAHLYLFQTSIICLVFNFNFFNNFLMQDITNIYHAFF